ncbi:hypothetical protein [uncultured Deinococcus sp.]|uniref:hypothetical protein n=1 Tax=uncultured Deinococcus sp. TaxID=158789 RepID=UPI0025DC33DE|nr:hypothetical protein [uncultured Deinococcus sp.]
MSQVRGRSPYHAVEHPASVRLLLNYRDRQVLAPFFRAPISIHAAALELGLKPNSLLKRVRRLVHAGLLREAQPPPGVRWRARHYQTVSPRFFVPFQATASATVEHLLDEVVAQAHRSVVAGMARALEPYARTLGYIVEYDGTGQVVHHVSLDGQRTYEDFSGDGPLWLRRAAILRLEAGQGQQFRADLLALMKTYEARSGAGSAYVVSVALAPEVDG